MTGMDHWADKKGDIDEWDGGDHEDCWPENCGWASGGKHPQCAFAALPPMQELDEAVNQVRVDRLTEIVAANDAVVLNVVRRAIQVWSPCMDGQLGAHVPLPTELFEALVLAQEQ